MTLKNRKPNEKLRDRLDIDSISEIMHKGRLRWFGHVERMGISSCVKRYMNMNRRRDRGQPRKTWDVLLRDDLRVKGLTRGLAKDCAAWKAAIR